VQLNDGSRHATNPLEELLLEVHMRFFPTVQPIKLNIGKITNLAIGGKELLIY